MDDVADDGGDGAKRTASEGAPATNDDDDDDDDCSRGRDKNAAPVSSRIRGRNPAAVEWPNVRDSPWAYRSPPNARSSVRDSDQSYFAPPTVAGVAAGVFADERRVARLGRNRELVGGVGRGESHSVGGEGFEGGRGGRGTRRAGRQAPGIDAGAFVDYYSKLLSTTEETLRKTKGAE